MYFCFFFAFLLICLKNASSQMHKNLNTFPFSPAFGDLYLAVKLTAAFVAKQKYIKRCMVEPIYSQFPNFVPR